MKRVPVLGGAIQDAAEPSYSCDVCATKLLGRSPEALRLIDKINDEAVSESSSATRDALSVTQLYNALLLKADKHDVVLYIKTAAADARGWMQKATLSGHALYSIPVSLLDELKRTYSTACETHAVNFDAFLLNKILQGTTASLAVKKMWFNSMRVFFCETAHRGRNSSCSRQVPRLMRCLCS